MLAFASALFAAVLSGALVAWPRGWIVLVAAIGGAWLLAWSLHWRAAMLAMFLFIPVAAVPGILLQQQGWPTLLKDGLFVLPAYLGLIATVAAGRTFGWPLPAGLTISLLGLVLIVVLQAARVMTVYPLVGLIGLKTWVLYLPLLLVPAVAFVSIHDVRRFMHLLVLVSIIPSVVALGEFILVVTGHEDLAYQWYGELGSSVSQGFGQVGLSEQILVHRIPSTFTFVTQFVAYCLVTAPLCMITWMSDPDARWRRVAAVGSLLVIASGFASGSRTFYLWGPIEVGLVLLLLNRSRTKVAAAIAVSAASAAFAVGSQLVQLTTYLPSLAWDYLVRVQAAEFPDVYGIAGLFGVGAGVGTNASRYVLPAQALPYGIEGWYALTFLELGLPGLMLVLLIWILLLRHSWMSVRLTRGSDANPIAIGAFIILLTTVPNLYKGVSLEYDPLNVYLWAVAGLALVLPRLVSTADDRREEDRSESPSVRRGPPRT
jgi:hypothetical protein